MHKVVFDWRFEAGLEPINPGNPFGEIYAERGWYCKIDPSDRNEFESWMKEHCPTAKIDYRFNSGNPMYFIHIIEDSEATLFSLKYL